MYPENVDNLVPINTRAYEQTNISMTPNIYSGVSTSIKCLNSRNMRTLYLQINEKEKDFKYVLSFKNFWMEDGKRQH